jgi:drug/metabolite transporter (DMT)-like permease
MGLLLAGLSSILFVALDVLRKVLGRRLSAVDIVIGISLGAAAVFAVILGIYGSTSFDEVFLLVAAVESVAFTIASLLYVRAVTLSPLSLTIPYLGFTPVVSVVVAFFVLGESPSLQGVIGILLVVVGAVALHLGGKGSIGALIRAPFREPGSWMMLLVALIWGITTSLDKIAIRHGSESLLGFSLTAGSAVILIVIRSFRKRRTGVPFRWSDRKNLSLLALASLVGAAAVLCQFFAYRELFVAYVETIKRAGGLASVLIGVFIFKEGGLAYRFPAAVLMLIGIALILLH